MLNSVRRIKKEEEEMKKRMELRKAGLAQKRNNNNTAMVPQYYRWPGLRRPLTARTVTVVALSLSVATVAWICNYIRPNLEGL